MKKKLEDVQRNQFLETKKLAIPTIDCFLDLFPRVIECMYKKLQKQLASIKYLESMGLKYFSISLFNLILLTYSLTPTNYFKLHGAQQTQY